MHECNFKQTKKNCVWFLGNELNPIHSLTRNSNVTEVSFSYGFQLAGSGLHNSHKVQCEVLMVQNEEVRVDANGQRRAQRVMEVSCGFCLRLTVMLGGFHVVGAKWNT